MTKKIAIDVSEISKTFKLPHDRRNSVKSLFTSFFKPTTYEKQQALKHISFNVEYGEFFGIVGRNGCGKSTLLKMLAGIYVPSSGTIQVNGKLTAFIELGVGFNPDLTGRENVFLNGALLGFNRQEMNALYDEIVEFAELEQFMDQKMKNYSSGMQVRLAFSIAIRARSDILLLDEVLAVGDALFQQKCFNYFHKLKKEGKTVLLVSHDANVLRQYCTAGILIEQGEIVSHGSIDKVLGDYTEILSKKENHDLNSLKNSKLTPVTRRGTGKVFVEAVHTLDVKYNPKRVFGDNDEEIVIEVNYKANEDVETPVYGIVIRDIAGLAIFTSNNLWKLEKSPNLNKKSIQKVRWIIPNLFNTGEFYISPAVTDQFGKETYDWLDNMDSFKVRKRITSTSITNPSYNMHFIKIEK